MEILHHCVYCGDSCLPTRDHFYPKSRGGRKTVVSCAPCNRLKANLLPLEWIAKLSVSKHPKKIRIISATRKLIERFSDEAKRLGLEEYEIDLRLVTQHVKRQDKKDKVLKKVAKQAVSLRAVGVNRDRLKALRGCKCGTSVIASLINTYLMIRFWKLNVYHGAQNPCTCA